MENNVVVINDGATIYGPIDNVIDYVKDETKTELDTCDNVNDEWVEIFNSLKYHQAAKPEMFIKVNVDDFGWSAIEMKEGKALQ
jgi:hypothetical protein